MSEQDTTPETDDTTSEVEDNTEATETEAPEATEPEAEDWRKDFDPEKAADRIRKLQSEAKNLRTRAKQAEEKAAGVGEKDQRIKALEADLLRERVGRRLNLPDELVDRLRGDTEDDLLSDAEKLVGLLKQPTAAPTRKPAEVLRGGGQPDQEPDERDLDKIGARMFRR